MSRRTQDIPIRPRYGLTEEELQTEIEEEKSIKTRKTSMSNSDMSSSYKEIPFLAQFAGPIPDSVLNDLTPTANQPENPNAEPKDCSFDDGEDDEDSKSSSYDNSNKTPKRPQSFLSDAIPYELEGSDDQAEGQMRHFVAENLEEKLRSSSPQGREGFL